MYTQQSRQIPENPNQALTQLEDNNQAQQIEIPDDVDPHSVNLYYKIRELTSMINKQNTKITEQSNMIVGLQKESDALKRSQAFTDNLEREQRKAQEKINHLEKLNDGIYDTEQSKIKQLQSKIEELKRGKEHEQAVNRKNLDVFHQKIEASNYIEMENRINKEEIAELKEEKQRLIKETEKAIRKKEINNQNKYSQLKKKMVENLAETKKNVTNLNLEYIDVSNKLTVMQNHQLIIQLEYQAEKIEELEREKDYLSRKVSELQREMIIHKEVELSLAERVKSKLVLGDNANNNNNNNNNASNSNTNVNTESNQLRLFNEQSIAEMQKDINCNHLERRIISLEKKMKEKTTELERIKLNNNELKNRISQYEKKYSSLFNFFEDNLNYFCQDEDLVKNDNLYINIDQIKKCDFNIFSPEEKYSLLVLMMKYLLPIVSCNVNNSASLGNGVFETNLNLITKKINVNERYLKDNELKRAFLGKNNKIQKELRKVNNSNTYCLTDSIPLIRKTQSETDPRLSNSKYKAVFV